MKLGDRETGVYFRLETFLPYFYLPKVPGIPSGRLKKIQQGHSIYWKISKDFDDGQGSALSKIKIHLRRISLPLSGLVTVKISRDCYTWNSVVSLSGETQTKTVRPCRNQKQYENPPSLQNPVTTWPHYLWLITRQRSHCGHQLATTGIPGYHPGGNEGRWCHPGEIPTPVGIWVTGAVSYKYPQFLVRI